jgi:hypothetical protein
MAIICSFAVIALLAKYAQKAKVNRKSHSPCGNRNIRSELKMKVTEVRIRLANEAFVKAYLPSASTIAFWSMTSGVIKGPTGLFISFPNRTKSGGRSAGYHFRPTLKHEG